MTSRYGREKSKGPVYTQDDCHYIAPLILNPKTGKEVLSILPLFYFCPLPIKTLGIKAALRLFGPFYDLQLSKESINDVLILLEIDPSSREILITETVKDQNFDKVVEFLNLYEHSVNNNLILTQTLVFYIKSLKTNNRGFEDIESRVDSIISLTIIELESFSVFDMFDSSKFLKSGSTEIVVSLFYQDLLRSLISESESGSIKIFELFEVFLQSLDNKSIF